MNCEETFRRLQEYLDRELTTEERTSVERHLGGCGGCSEEFKFEESVLRHIRRALADDDLPPDLAAAVAKALDKA